MQEKILKLCRRLKKCSLDDIIQFTEIESEKLRPILYYLLDNNEIVENNGIYSVSNITPIRNDKNINLMIPYHSEEDIEIITKGFCLEIPTGKLQYLVKCKENCICQFHQTFRQKIYERQHEILSNNYSKNPKVARIGTFFEKQAFFYFYDEQVFVSDKPLRADKEKPLTKQETKEYKKVYSYLKRVENHNINESYMFYRLAEMIWRRNKGYENLYSDLKNIILFNIS